MMSSVAFRRALPVLALASTAACGPLPLPHPVREPRAQSVAVTVTEVPGEDSWQVGYILPFEAQGVELVRGRNAFRHERWGVGLHEGEPEWHVDGGRERLCFTRPARAFSVGFRTWTDPLPKDYPLNVAFSEGSRLLYTGHLLVRPLTSCGETAAEAPPGEPEHRFTFRTREERSIRVLDQAAAGELVWRPDPDHDQGAETYVYFGSLPAVETEAATVLLDPGLPEWMKSEMAREVPRLVERFAAATSTPLPFRPLLLVAWGGAGGSGISFSGGTLPGLLLASAEGPGWVSETPEARQEWFHRIAHETFHLWDGETYRPEEDSEWLSEAAADHFAADAAVAFGVRSEPDARRWLVERANDCIVRLGGRSLVAAVGAGDFRAWYSCGAVAMAAADGALRHGAPPSDLATLFRRLFEHAAATGGYGTAAFFGGLQELHAEPAAQAALRRLIRDGGIARSDTFLQGLLGRAGVATEPAPPEEAAADPATLREMVRRAVGRCYCGTEAAEVCDPAETGQGVTAVAGERIGEGTLAAWQHLRSAIARDAALPVVLGGEEVTLFCTGDSFDPTWDSLLTLVEPAAG